MALTHWFEWPKADFVSLVRENGSDIITVIAVWVVCPNNIPNKLDVLLGSSLIMMLLR